MKSNRVLKLAIVFALTSAAGLATAADEVDEQKPLGEIIVTAQKREQKLQDVPIVVTVVDAQLLQDNGVHDIKDLTMLTPGLLVTSTASEASTTARIRGIGTVGDNPGLESSVGIVIDGVYRPRNGAGLGDLGEIQQIEVLKGPQGTLFGKNTSAGVINVITKKPTFNNEFSAELGGGNYNLQEGSLSLNGGIIDDLVAGRIYFGVRQRDGFINTVRGLGPNSSEKSNDRDVITARAQLLFNLTSSFDLRTTFDYSQRNEICCAGVQVISSAARPIVDALAPLDSGVAFTPDPYARYAFSNRAIPQDTKDSGVSFELNGDIGEISLVSITSGREWSQIGVQDADFASADIWYRPASTAFRTLTQEVRLNGQAGKVNWLAGAFYAHEKLYQTFSYLYGSSFETYASLVASGGTNPGLLAGLTAMAPGTMYPANLGMTDFFDQSGDSFALFTNESIQFTDKMELTVGARYTRDSKDMESFFRNANGAGSAACRDLAMRFAAYQAGQPYRGQSPAFPSAAVAAGVMGLGCLPYSDPAFTYLDTKQSLSESKFTGTLKLAYRFNEAVMSYVSYARGYKGGGFNMDRERTTVGVVDSNTSFNEELVDSFEIGTKTNWLNDSLALNASVFHQKFTDFQYNAFTGLSFVVLSIPEVVSKGIDTDLLWRTPLSGVSLQAGITYADTEITEYPAVSIFSPLRTSDQMSFAPKWSGSAAITGELPVGDYVWRGNLSAKYNSSYNTGSNLDPRKSQDAYTIMNLRFAFGSSDDIWAIEAWAMNLLDKDYAQVMFDSPLQGSSSSNPPSSGINAFLGAPRTVGVTARFKVK